jgi:hypothetical protein
MASNTKYVDYTHDVCTRNRLFGFHRMILDTLEIVVVARLNHYILIGVSDGRQIQVRWVCLYIQYVVDLFPGDLYTLIKFCLRLFLIECLGSQPWQGRFESRWLITRNVAEVRVSGLENGIGSSNHREDRKVKLFLRKSPRDFKTDEAS